MNKAIACMHTCGSCSVFMYVTAASAAHALRPAQPQRNCGRRLARPHDTHALRHRRTNYLMRPPDGHCSFVRPLCFDCMLRPAGRLTSADKNMDGAADEHACGPAGRDQPVDRGPHMHACMRRLFAYVKQE
jgi:hypothetical protein